MLRIHVGSTKYEIELFDGKHNFILWHSIIIDVLTTQALDAALRKINLQRSRKPSGNACKRRQYVRFV